MFWFSLRTMMSDWEHPSSDYLKKLTSVHYSVGATRPFAQLFSCFGRRLLPPNRNLEAHKILVGLSNKQPKGRPRSVKICLTLNPARVCQLNHRSHLQFSCFRLLTLCPVLELSNCHEQVRLLVAHLQGSHHCLPVNTPRPASHANLPGVHKLLNHLYAAEPRSAEDSFEGIPSVVHGVCRLQAFAFSPARRLERSSGRCVLRLRRQEAQADCCRPLSPGRR
jgi:hypothetical protein